MDRAWLEDRTVSGLIGHALRLYLELAESRRHSRMPSPRMLPSSRRCLEHADMEHPEYRILPRSGQSPEPTADIHRPVENRGRWMRLRAQLQACGCSYELPRYRQGLGLDRGAHRRENHVFSVTS